MYTSLTPNCRCIGSNSTSNSTSSTSNTSRLETDASQALAQRETRECQGLATQTRCKSHIHYL